MNGKPAEIDQDELLAQALALQLWEEYWTDRSQETDAERERYRQLFTRVYGGEQDSPMCLMFISFVGGLTQGFHLSTKIATEE